MLRLLDHPRIAWLAAALAVVLTLPSLAGGIAADDWFHRAHFDADTSLLPPGRGPLLDLFAFFPSDPEALRDLVRRGVLPWWTDPEIRGAFFRPVAALTHGFDWRVLGDAVVLHHAHSLAWLAASVLAAGALFRGWLGPGRAAALATLLFAVDDAHAWPAAWLANRNALLAMTFGALAAASHLRGREGSRVAIVATPLLLLLALLSAEAGLATLVLLAAVEVGVPDRGRLRRWAPIVAAVAGWAVAWRGLGFGIHGSGLYVDPVGAPARFWALVPERVGALSAATWLNAPVDFWVLLTPWISWPLGVTLGALAAGVVVTVLAPTLRSELRARQALAVSVLALLPPCAAFPMERVITFAGMGACALLGLHLATHTRLRDRALLAWHGPVSAVLLLAKSVGVPVLLAQSVTMVDDLPADPAVSRQTVIVVSGLELATAYVPILNAYSGRPTPAAFAILAPVATSLVVWREDDRTLRLDAPAGAFRHAFERLCRDAPFRAGETVDTGVVRVEVLVTDEEGHPTRLRARFPRPLDDEGYRWFVPVDGGLVPWRPPGPGESVAVPAMLPLP